MKLFKEIQPPVPFEEVSNECKAKWLTWSDDFLSFQDQIIKESQKYGAPEILVFQGRYKSQSYTVDLNRLDPSFLNKINDCSSFLSKIKIKEELYFFDKLISDSFNSQSFRFFICCLRAKLSSRRKDGMASLYIPIGAVEGENEFPVHSDLFIPIYLWNIFDEVFTSNQGCPLLLPVATLLNQIVKQIDNFPEDKYNFLKYIFGDKVVYNEDGYDQLIAVLHGKENWWSQEVKEGIEKYVLKIKFGRGQGYLINDRKWLHGRSFSSESVTSNRLHRLVF